MNIELGNQKLLIKVTTPMTACMAEYGPRFETLGAVTSWICDGNSLLAREGLIDEFNIQAPLTPPGYDVAKPGEPFVKIGVGELIRSDDNGYSFSYPHPVQCLAPVTMDRDGDVLKLSQQMQSATGWGYAYAKTYRLFPDAATLVIEYSLTNIGELPLNAEQYDHNWFNFGGGAIDDNYFLETRFGVGEPTGDWFKYSAQRFDLTRLIEKGSYSPSPLGAPATQNWMRIGHRSLGQSIVVTGDFDVARFALYADSTALCPEVFGEFKLAAGQSMNWQRKYEFCR